AKSLNCLKRQKKESEPCNECESCQEVMAGRALDLIEIDAASNTGVDNVRENIIDGSRFTPSSRQYKVYIIDEVHMLSAAAFNALLKTLEEPPAHVIFILATTEIHKLPATIISRCQRFDFKKVGASELVSRLKRITIEEKKELEEKTLQSIARLSEGCLRDAESLLGQVLSLGDKKITAEQAELVIPRSELNLVYELIGYLIKNDLAKAIALINRLTEEGVELGQFVDDLIEVLRKMLLAKISGGLTDLVLDLDEEAEKQILALTQEVEINRLFKMIESFIDKRKEVRLSEISQLPLELAIIELGINGLASPLAHLPRSPRFAGEAGGTAGQGGPEKINEPVKKEEKNPPSAPPSANWRGEWRSGEPPAADKSIIDLSIIQRDWPKFLQAVKENNQSLALILRVCRAEAIKNDKIQFCFQYKFHNDILQEPKNKKIVDEVLAKIFGQGIGFEGNVKEDETRSEIGNLLETFGGEVVS
ncbi:MAG: DNA polymerase III subunit gamma/tau, partial [bacterium]